MADTHIDEHHHDSGGIGAVGIVAIIILVLIAAFFVVRAVGTGNDGGSDVNVSVPLPGGDSNSGGGTGGY